MSSNPICRLKEQPTFFLQFIIHYAPLAEKAMAPHSRTLAWRIPWMEEPGRLQSMGLLRVGHDWATSLSLFTLCIGEGNGNPLQCSCLENPRDGGAWWAAVYGVTHSRTRLKWLSSSLLWGTTKSSGPSCILPAQLLGSVIHPRSLGSSLGEKSIQILCLLIKLLFF